MAAGGFSQLLTPSHKLKKSQKTFKKPIDKYRSLWYNITVVKNNTNHLGV